jgi:hypothetical protein
MRKIINGMKATAMDMHIRNIIDDIEDDDTAEMVFDTWLSYGVPDGNELYDNCVDFGNIDDFASLWEEYKDLCEHYGIDMNYSKELKEIQKKFNEILDKIN